MLGIHQEITVADLRSAFAMLALMIACVGLCGTIRVCAEGVSKST
jgi:hypothetical protein